MRYLMELLLQGGESITAVAKLHDGTEWALRHMTVALTWSEKHSHLTRMHNATMLKRRDWFSG